MRARVKGSGASRDLPASDHLRAQAPLLPHTACDREEEVSRWGGRGWGHRVRTGEKATAGLGALRLPGPKR